MILARAGLLPPPSLLQRLLLLLYKSLPFSTRKLTGTMRTCVIVQLLQRW